MAKKINNNVVAGLTLLLFGVLLYVYLIPTQVPQSDGMPLALSPQLFCRISAGCLIFLSVLLLAGSNRIETDEDENISSGAELREQWLRGGVSVILSVIYITLISFLGYFVSTFLILTVFTLFFGGKNWPVIIATQLGVLCFIYLLFVKGLRVILPDGFLF